ncbi:MAG: hypothetical protein AABW50_01080 [Nanoarchaeota archaeon]
MVKLTSDAENRRAILESENPRVTAYNEGMNCINPLTGRSYNQIKEKSYGSRFLSYQVSLARIDLREKKINDSEFFRNKELIINLVNRMTESNIPLSLISSPDGLDQALKEIEAKESINPEEDKTEDVFSKYWRTIDKSKNRIEKHFTPNNYVIEEENLEEWSTKKFR